jgi:hypothetical protein
MTQIDFGVAFFLLVTIIIYSISVVSANITNDFNYFNSEKVEKAASTIESNLFDVKDTNSLVSEFKQIQISFDEVGGIPHTTTLDIQIMPEVSKVHVYDKTYNEITSAVTSLSGQTNVSFDLDFLAFETKYVYIAYEGINTSSIDYTSDVSANNVTAVIVSEKEIYVLSQAKCSQLQSMSFDESKNLFGFTESFRISNECIHGPQPPSANVIVNNIPILKEQSDGTIQSTKIQLVVW